MEYIMTFLEGIISFISPCVLPILPIYISYFTGDTNKRSKTFLSALGFVLGFTFVFCALGLFAGGLGSLLLKYHELVDIVCGIIIIAFGLSFLEIIHIPHPEGVKTVKKSKGIFSAFVFGIVFSISHAPCMSAFLGTALVTASASGIPLKGVFLLLSYSVGLGIPFLVSALLIEKLNPVFKAIKKNYKPLRLVCGGLLIVLGICMATGVFHELAHLI